MSYLSHLYLPGAVALWCALVFSVSCLWGYSLVLRGDGSSLHFARRAYNFFAMAVLLVAGLLALLLLLRDFRIEYVHSYSGLDLPAHYQFAAFWAGQQGSFLIWLVWGTLLGLALKRSAGKAEPAVMSIYLLTLLGLVFILVRNSPFAMRADSPLDGKGLNPLLQDDWMVIHPPIMFIGFAASAIPFAFAMAALWRRDYDGWAARAFPWALGGFLVLGTAILMGGYWAYKTLGWGGYWGWDPVENASFVPWIFGTALIHGLHMERTRGRYRRANFVLATLVFLSVLYGTFLTRSGVLADFSVHSFVDLGLSGWLVGIMAFFMLLSGYLLATRLPKVPTAKNEDPALSRGTFLVLATITLVVAALAITAGTSAPLITRVMKNPAQVGIEWYNRVNLPIAMLVSLLLSLVPVLTWRGNGAREVVRKLTWPLLVAATATAAAAAWQMRNPLHLGFAFLAVLALASNLQKTIEKTRATGMNGLRASGGYLAHVGVGIILIGVLASSAYDESTKVTLEKGVPQRVGNMTLTFVKYIPRQGGEKDKMEVEITRGGERFNVYPKFFMNERTRQLMINPDIRHSALQDLYISPIEYDSGQPRLELALGQTGQAGDTRVRFVRFNLQVAGNALAQMASGKPITIGAEIELSRAGSSTVVTPIYRLNPTTGMVETPATSVPGGGAIVLAGINASTHKIQLALAGIGSRPKLSIDVTHKPLIKLVWGGLYVVLLGGVFSTAYRIREIALRDRIAAAATLATLAPNAPKAPPQEP